MTNEERAKKLAIEVDIIANGEIANDIRIGMLSRCIIAHDDKIRREERAILEKYRADWRKQLDEAVTNRTRRESRLERALREIYDAWDNYGRGRSDYSQGYDDALDMCSDIALAALKDGEEE